MAMKSMVERDCGGVNPLMGLTNEMMKSSQLQNNLQEVINYQNLSQELYNQPIYSTENIKKTDVFSSTNSYGNLAPTTFNMQTLLSEVQQIIPQQSQNYSKPEVHSSQQQLKKFQQPLPLADPIMTIDWLQEFHSQPITVEHGSYDLNSELGNTNFIKSFDRHKGHPFEQQSISQFKPFLNERQINQPFIRQNFEFFERFANDAELSSNKHFREDLEHYFKELDEKDIDLEPGMTFELQGSSQVTKHDERNPLENTDRKNSNNIPTLNDNVNYSASSKINNNVSGDGDEEFDELWGNMQDNWKNIVENYTPSWEYEFWQGLEEDDNYFYKTYKFDEDNVLLNDNTDERSDASKFEDFLNEGVKRLKEGDVANAVLFLEAAVHKDPKNSEAWFYLGTAQADNEQEPSAIAAFNKCLELDPNNLKALMSLAVGYTNESLPHKACNALRDWLLKNDKYSSLVSLRMNEATRSNYKSHSELLDLFLEVVHTSSDHIDPEIQIGMGVLFNLSGEYEKAVDCFQTALQVTPEDSMLWNKLGATLANGQRSEEAINAYHRALNLRPGYIRTRFNLGVACVNLGAYREAVEHFLSALTLKSQTKGPIAGSKSNSNNNNIWSSLRMALSLLGRSDMLDNCDRQCLEALNEEFK